MCARCAFMTLIGTGCPVLLTHIASSKWKEFSGCPYASICMVSESKLVQLVVRGKLTLETGRQMLKSGAYWERVRPDVRRSILLNIL